MNDMNQFKYNTKSNFLDYLILTFIIMWSGGCVTYKLFNDWPIYAFFLLLFVANSRKVNISYKNLVPFFVVTILLFLQMFKFGGDLTTAIHYSLICFVCTLTALILRNKFADVFVKIMLFFSVISLVFYAVDILGGHGFLLELSNYFPQGGRETMAEFDAQRENSRTLWLYQVANYDMKWLNNAGPFFERGRYVVFLCLALFINLFNRQLSLKSKSSIVLLITIITTFSTTGYIALLVIIFTYIILGSTSRAEKILCAIIFASALPSILGLDFMTEKISNQMNDSVEYSRFGAMAYHWGYLIQSPILGYGPYRAIALSGFLESPNGITEALLLFGIPGALFFFYCLYRGTRIFVSERRLLYISCFIVLMTLSFTQTMFYSPFWFVLYGFAFCDNRHFSQIIE